MVDQTYQAEVAEFNNHWNKVIQDYLEECKDQEQKTLQKHQSQAKKERDRLESIAPITYKPSTQLLNMIKSKERAVQTQKHIEANNLLKQIEELKSYEQTKHLEVRQVKIEKQMIIFKNKLQKETENFNKRKKTRLDELSKQRNIEFDLIGKKSSVHPNKQFITRTRIQDRLSSTRYNPNNNRNKKISFTRNMRSSKTVLNPVTANNYVSQTLEWPSISENLDSVTISGNLSYQSDIERILILLTPKAVKQEKIGEIIEKLQSKGLVLRDSKLLPLTAKMMERLFSGRLKDSEEKSCAMCWEGPDAKNMIKNFSKDPRELGAETMYLLYWPELVAPKLSVIFSEEEMRKWDLNTEPRQLQIPELTH